MMTATTSRLPSACTLTITAAAISASTARSTGSRAGAEGGRARAVEPDREQLPVQQREGRDDARRRGPPSGEIGAGDRQHVPEEELVQAGRRGGREREQDAEPEQDRDDDRDGGVPPDPGARARGRRAGRDRHAHADRAAEHEREAEQRREHEPGEERVRERLGAVGELVEDDPAAERPPAIPRERAPRNARR